MKTTSDNTQQKNVLETGLVADVSEKLEVIMTPGTVVEMLPNEAEFAGAFPEDALSIEDALEASLDMEA